MNRSIQIYTYEEIPDLIRIKPEALNAYYTREYFDYVKMQKEEPLYFCSEEYCLLVILKTKFLFNIAKIPAEYIKLNEDIGNAEEFMTSVIEILKKKYNVLWVGPSAPCALFEETPLNAMKIPFGSYIINLEKSEEEIWAGIHSKHRNVIRKAEKENVVIKRGGKELIEEYMPIEKTTWDRSGRTGNTPDFYQQMFDCMPSQMKIYLAYKDEQVQGGAIFLFYSSQCYYLYGASIDKPSSGAMNLLHWIAMKDMKEWGVKQYNFVGCRIGVQSGSKLDGIQRFKERFGGELVQGYMFKVICKPLLYWVYKEILYIKKNRGRKYPIDIIEEEYSKWN